MKRSQFIRTSAFTLAALSIGDYKSFAHLFVDPWKIRMLRNDIGIFTERGGTIGFLLSKKGMVVIDSEFPEQAQHLITELKKKSDKSFKLLINTHHHGDH